MSRPVELVDVEALDLRVLAAEHRVALAARAVARARGRALERALARLVVLSAAEVKATRARDALLRAYLRQRRRQRAAG